MNDDELDLELRRAIRAEAYRPRMTLKPDLLSVRLAGGRAARNRALWRSFVAALIGIGAVVGIIALTNLPRWSGIGGVAPTNLCEVSPAVSHGSWWKEIGGPNAFFNAEPNSFHAEPNNWLIITRFDPDASPGQLVQMWADRLGPGDHIPGSYNSPMDPTNIYRGSEPAPKLPGGWYLFEQRFPVPGCWQLSAAIDGRVVGTATLSVGVGTYATAPVGTYMTNKAIPGEPCFAFKSSDVNYEEATAVTAWWWAQGASGDCLSRTSDVVTSTANIVPRTDSGYDLVLRIPMLTGESHEIRVALHMSGGSLAGVAVSADNASVFFTWIQEVDPSFAPVSP